MSVPEGFKPLLAINSDDVKTKPEAMHYSVKLNGVRSIIFNGVAYSRSLKPLPNKQLQDYVRSNMPNLQGIDCEVVVGNVYASNVLSESVSFCMSEDKQTADFTLYVFDCYIPNKPWIERFTTACNMVKYLSKAVAVPHFEYTTEEDLQEFEQNVLAAGGEGVMLRDTFGKYKTGRSGKIKPELQKVKRFLDAEFEIVGFYEELENTNEATTNELGRTQRSTEKAGMKPKGTLGGFYCKTKLGHEFGVGSGFTAAERKELWINPEQYIGKMLTVKYFPVGNELVPLLPTYVGIRNPLDMSE
jgi:DNA ligase 1